MNADRQAAVAALTAQPLEVLVVGGGIVGAGVARDAAMRGLRVGLVEQADFASGTSSRSSRLLHGGLRYLAQGRLGLVYEASREKCVLSRIAPHLAAPLAFVFPTYSGGGWPRWQLAVGVKLYDLLCGGRNFGPSQSLRPADVQAMLPGIRAVGLTGGVRYFDALTNDARLVLDTLRSAAGAGAIVLNYARLRDAVRSGDRWRCEVEDVLAVTTFDLAARVVVNAAGPWADRLPHSSIRLRLTKGIHLVVAQSRLPVADAVVLTDGPRILFAIPWGERVILGTTDTDYAGLPEAVGVERADVDYVLAAVNRTLLGAKLTAADVLAAWAGLRPLIATGRGGPSDISRAHEIRTPQPGWIDVAGGKLTTYRLIAEQTVDRAAKALGRRLPPCRTADEPLLPPGETAGISGILPPPLGREVVEHFCRREWAERLDDVMLRRTSWGYYLNDAAGAAAQVAEWMAAALGWDAARLAAEQSQYQAHDPSRLPATT